MKNLKEVEFQAIKQFQDNQSKTIKPADKGRGNSHYGNSKEYWGMHETT